MLNLDLAEWKEFYYIGMKKYDTYLQHLTVLIMKKSKLEYFRKYRKKNRVRINARSRQRYNSIPSVRRKIIAAVKKYKKNNKEKVKAYLRKRYKENPKIRKKILLTYKKWVKNNRERRNKYMREYNARCKT